ncbi:hypothetical protein FBY54_1836 [Zymomonas mobilis]|uniref:Uncharacterized protein n=1 Tax=Zymomonas mobilis subsp. mobilis (strain ATCC 10988 / DSM 424 / LMG 404 / NCIMB 8938 / NRRL B-806 / ZM1) TaxID=555217 RepID=A0A0H3G0R1_ZYMMA|nr:hypothetical protein Zmob_1756 [Zymomonas mobilis subsp. mobilis ATCC 10988]TQL26717.1 hypothetical protein FBY54_1836 [Zymomonas mobilis]
MFKDTGTLFKDLGIYSGRVDRKRLTTTTDEDTVFGPATAWRAVAA